jgi:hypothetical protein
MGVKMPLPPDGKMPSAVQVKVKYKVETLSINMSRAAFTHGVKVLDPNDPNFDRQQRKCVNYETDGDDSCADLGYWHVRDNPLNFSAYPPYMNLHGGYVDRNFDQPVIYHKDNSERMLRYPKYFEQGTVPPLEDIKSNFLSKHFLETQCGYYGRGTNESYWTADYPRTQADIDFDNQFMDIVAFTHGTSLFNWSASYMGPCGFTPYQGECDSQAGTCQGQILVWKNNRFVQTEVTKPYRPDNITYEIRKESHRVYNTVTYDEQEKIFTVVYPSDHSYAGKMIMFFDIQDFYDQTCNARRAQTRITVDDLIIEYIY